MSKEKKKKQKKEKKDNGYTMFSIFSARKRQLDRMIDEAETGRKVSDR